MLRNAKQLLVARSAVQKLRNPGFVPLACHPALLAVANAAAQRKAASRRALFTLRKQGVSLLTRHPALLAVADAADALKVAGREDRVVVRQQRGALKAGQAGAQQLVCDFSAVWLKVEKILNQGKGDLG